MNFINVNLNFEIKELLKYMEKVCKAIGKEMKQSDMKKTLLIFKNTTREIYSNLAFLNNYNLKNIRAHRINSPEVKRILNKEIGTKFSEQFLQLSGKIPQLKVNDKLRLIDMLELNRHKISEMKKYSKKTDKELLKFKRFNPISRFNHIKSVYIAIAKAIK